MDIEKEIFEGTRVVVDSLLSYGFIKKRGFYEYSQVFMTTFKAHIIIDNQGLVKGKVYDLNFGDEYVNFRFENQEGEFVNRVGEEYRTILEDIKQTCFESLYFISDQANRLTKKIIEKYKDKPDFMWEKFPRFGVFRNPNNEKWYALIMNIDKSKIGEFKPDKVDIINLKLDSKEIPTLLKKDGIYPSYHMNKKHWVTIVLDDSLSDEEIMSYVSVSHGYTEGSNEWVIPANP